jgi:hypothetical protein
VRAIAVNRRGHSRRLMRGAKLLMCMPRSSLRV